MPSAAEVLTELECLANPGIVDGMKRFGINTDHTLGISIYVLRDIAKRVGIDHQLALDLWGSGIHEARILASMVDDPSLVTEEQMDRWTNGFDSWDTCDQVTSNLFDKTPYAYQKAAEWSLREEEFVKRAAFALIAALAVQDKNATNEQLEPFFEIIYHEACDDRNFVKKAVNWALRNLGKRNAELNRRAIDTASKIKEIDCRSARWIAADALHELESEKVQARITKGRK
jgi:3-methyladenine DNA glycosylase AlkD